MSAAYHEYGIRAGASLLSKTWPPRTGRLIFLYAGRATSIAEITAMGRASILIPYPFAVGGHQEMNASVLADAGAAEMILEERLDGETLAGAIRRLAENPEMIGRMEAASARFGNVKAAARIVDECMALLDEKSAAQTGRI